jgi:hypothetical protein
MGLKMLQPANGSYVDIVCKGDQGLAIKWFFNNTEVASDSYSIIKSKETIISKLRVNYTSADDVYEKYSCGEVILQKRNCTSLDYICQIDYGSYIKEQRRGMISTELGKCIYKCTDVHVSSNSLSNSYQN